LSVALDKFLQNTIFNNALTHHFAEFQYGTYPEPNCVFRMSL